MILNDIKINQYLPAYVIYGDEPYIIDLDKKKLINAVIGDNTMNYSYFDSDSATYDLIKEAADTSPFFADYRLIVVEDTSLLSKQADKLIKYLPQIPSSTILVFIEKKMEVKAVEKNKLFKAIKELGGDNKIMKLSENDLLAFVGNRLSKAGKKIKRSDAKYLISKVGDSLYTLYNETEKLISSCKDKEIVDMSDIDAVCVDLIENNIYEIITYVLKNDSNNALRLFYDALESKVNSQRIISNLYYQFNEMLLVRDLKDRKMSPAAIAKKLGKPSFMLKNAMNLTNIADKHRLKSSLSLITEVLEEIRYGNIIDEKIGAEMLIIKLSSIN